MVDDSSGDDEPDSGSDGTDAASPATPDAEVPGDESPSDDRAEDGDAAVEDGDAAADDRAEATAGAEESPAAETGATGSSMRSREVVVPMRLYKTVTVFTTLISAVLVVAGFILLDTATNRARAALDEIDPVVAVLGLASIAAGGLLYAFASRFRAAGMGKDKDDADEGSDNG